MTISKINICLFGLDRASNVTVRSILKNLIDPLRALGIIVECFAVFNYPKNGFSNKRSGEFNRFTISPARKVSGGYDLSGLFVKDCKYLDQESLDKALKYDTMFRKVIDGYKDDYSSYKNIIRSLQSLKFSYQISARHPSDLYIFTRIDLFLIDKFSLPKYQDYFDVITNGRPILILPNWQTGGGINDRFAICNPTGAKIYAERVDLMSEYIDAVVSSGINVLDPEQFLLWTLLKTRANYHDCLVERSIRVRVGGVFREENFGEPSALRINEDKVRKVLLQEGTVF